MKTLERRSKTLTPTFVPQGVLLLLGAAFRSGQVVVEFLKANRLENPTLIVLAGGWGEGKQRGEGVRVREGE